MRWVMATGMVAAVLVATSCIAFVNPDSFGTTCSFANRGAACGACLASQCQSAIDACCTSDSCLPALPDVDLCAGGDRDACGRILSRASTSANDEASLRLSQCISKSCVNVCPYAVATVTRCSQPVLGSGKTCNCDVSAQPNAVVCSREAYPDTICCAPDGWPAEGQRCSCLKWACNPTGVGCGCLLTETSTKTDTSECTGANCCSDGFQCQCSSLPCRDDQKKVPACSLSFAECKAGTKAIDRCTVDAR